MNFQLIDSNKMLDMYANKVLSESPYGNVNVKSNHRPNLYEPALVYVCIDMLKLYNSGERGITSTPIICYHTLERRYAKKLVYSRTEKVLPVNSHRQLIFSADMFDAFIQNVNKGVLFRHNVNKNIKDVADQMLERNINELKKVYKDMGVLLLATISRGFEYVNNNGSRECYNVPYVLFLDRKTASNYIYQRKNKPPIRKLPTVKASDMFQNHVHTILALNLPNSPKGAKRRKPL